MQRGLFFYITVFFTLGYSFLVLAQPLPKLQQAFEEAATDTARIDALLELGHYYEVEYIDSGFYYVEKAIELAKAKKERERESMAIKTLAELYQAKGAFGEARRFFEKAMELASRGGYTKAEADIYNSLGLFHYRLGNFPEAARAYTESLKRFEKVENTLRVASVYNNLASVYADQADFETALTYQQKSLAIKVAQQDSVAMAISYYNTGRILYNMKAYEKATENLNTSLEICQKLNIKQGIAFNYSVLALVKEAKGAYKEAITLLEKYQMISKEVGDVGAVIEGLLQLGKVYRSAGKYKEAKAYLEQGVNQAEEMGMKGKVQHGWEELAATYAALGSFEQAYQAHQQFKNISDRLFNEEQTKQMTRLEEGYKFDQERQEMQAKEDVLKEEKARQEMLIWGAFVVLLALLVIVFLVYRQSKLRKQINVQLQTKNTEISTQKEEIRQQAEELQSVNDRLVSLDRFKEQMTGMIVHDLKSPLNTMLLLTNDPKNERLQMAHQASQQMLTLVTNMLDVQKFEDTKVRLNLKQVQAGELFRQALAQVSLSAELQNLSFKIEGNAYIFHVDPELTLRLLVNLLTNAIKFSPQNATITLKVAESPVQGQLQLSVKDEGKGIPKAKQAQIFERFGQAKIKKGSTGLGLTFCKLVAEAHGGQIGVRSDKGSEFWVRLPEGEKSNADSIPTTTTPSQNMQLSSREKRELLPLAEALQVLDVYQATRIYATLDQFSVDMNTKGISVWEEKLRQAVYGCNEELYEELLLLVHPFS